MKTKRIFSREDLAVSCFGMTRVEAHQFISNYERDFEAFISDKNNEAIISVNKKEFNLLKPFICKAQNYITYRVSSALPSDDYEKSLIKEIAEKLL